MSAIEIRSDESQATATLTGYASLFEPVSYTIGGGQYRYVEKVARGAFTETLRSSPDVVFRTEHEHMPLARTTAGNLTLTQDERGLRYEARLSLDDPDVRALIPKIKAGNLRESSFAFKVPEGGDSWNRDRTERTMHKLDLHRGDVSLVTFAASSDTAQYTHLRSDGSLQERRALAEAVSRGGWCGPGAGLRAAWANQHGSSCQDCTGSGRCQACDGNGWVATTDAGSGSALSAGRTNQTRALPPSRTTELEAEWMELQAELQARALKWDRR